MTRLAILALSAAVVCAACDHAPVFKYAPPTAKPWIPPDGTLAESDPDTMEHLQNVQRYARSHDGKLPPPDVNIDH